MCGFVGVRFFPPVLSRFMGVSNFMIVFEMATRKMLFCDFNVRIRGNELNGEALGEKINVQRHAPAAEVKGATLSELKVRQEPDGLWLVQCIVDV